MHDAAFSFYKQLFSRFLLLSAVFSTYKFHFFLSLCIISCFCTRSPGADHRYQIERYLIIFMGFNNTDLHMMLLKLGMTGYRLDKQAVTPVFIEVSIKNGSCAFVSIHNNLCNRRRPVDRFTILDRNSRCFNIKGDLISYIGSNKSSTENIQKLLLLMGILPETVKNRSAVIIFIPYRILILIGSNRIRKCFPVKIRICLFGITILINFL